MRMLVRLIMGGALNYSDYDHLIEVEKDDRRKRPYEAASDLLKKQNHFSLVSLME